MAFDTDEAAVFQIRLRHRNEEVRELIPSDYAGVMVTDRGKSYDAEELLGVKQQKCLDHLKENINEVLERKTGRARSFGQKLKSILQEARQLWRDHTTVFPRSRRRSRPALTKAEPICGSCHFGTTSTG